MRLPEFGNIEFGWGMCRNTMCANFGILYGSAEGPGGDELRYRPRYRHKRLVGIDCRSCGQYIRLYAAGAVRPLARHFLSESLPFADCPNEDCGNHGVNGFEYYGRNFGGRGRPYRQNRAHRLTCNECKTSISLGVARDLSDTPDVRQRVKELIHSVSQHRPVTDAFESDLGIATYYRRLLRLSARLRDYLAYRNSFLLKPGFCGQEERTARGYTDVFQLSLNKLGEGPTRSQLVNLIASVVALDRTYFILAAHLCFLPDSKAPSLLELDVDTQTVDPLERRWEGLITLLDDGPTIGKDGELLPTLADAGHPGFLMRSPYAEVAHFLVVQRLLSRFSRTFHYTDASADLSTSALVAMRDGVRSGRVQIALFQYEQGKKKKRKPKGRPKDYEPEAALRTAFDAVESAIEGELKIPLGGSGRRRRCARARAVVAPCGARCQIFPRRVCLAGLSARQQAIPPKPHALADAQAGRHG